MSGNMFHTLENTWDQSARRGWTTVASFTLQTMALSLLLLIPLLTVQGPPQLWTHFAERVLAPPAPPAPPSPIGPQHPIGGSEVSGFHVIQPPVIPAGVKPVIDNFAPAAPDVNTIGVAYSTSRYEVGINNSIGQSVTIVPPPLLPPSTRPLPVSHWAEGNLIYRVQPNYPPLARQARIQGTVELRAIISKMGMIENLSVVRGHAMLVPSAVEAVKQWRYRPYLLNGEPIEVETEITVNFILGGN